MLTSPADRQAENPEARPRKPGPCRPTYTSHVARRRGYWRWLGHRLRLSQPGRVLFTLALLLGVGAMVISRAHGDREGGAPLVMLALLLLGVVALDAVGRGVVDVVRRRILD